MPGALLAQHDRRHAPFSMQQRARSLDIILAHSPFRSEEAILAEFTDLGASGTKWVLWDCKDELDLSPPHPSYDSAPDIRLFGKKPFSWPHEVSLRGYLEILYYYDDAIAKRLVPVMAMEIQGSRVAPRNWTAYLHAAGKASYRPSTNGVASQAHMLFGYAKPFKDVVEEFQRRGIDKNRLGSEYQQLRDYSGVFYYHQGEDATTPGRLTLPLQKTKTQMRQNGIMPTTQIRIGTKGDALIGCCVENFLTQGHNKSQYVAADADQHTLLGLQAQVNNKMVDFLKKTVQHKLVHVTGKSLKRKMRLDSDEDSADDDNDEAKDARASSHGIATCAAEAEASGGLMGANDTLPCDHIDEGERYELIADPTVVGYAFWVGKDRKQLRLRLSPDSAKHSKGPFQPCEVQKSQLDTSSINMIPWRLLTISALNNTKVEVWWQHNAHDNRSGVGLNGEWYSGTLTMSANAPAGWFSIVYDDEDEYNQSEEVFIGICADADDLHEALAFRADGSDMRDEIRFDDAAMNAAAQPAASLPPHPPSAPPQQVAQPSELTQAPQAMPYRPSADHESSESTDRAAPSLHRLSTVETVTSEPLHGVEAPPMGLQVEASSKKVLTESSVTDGEYGRSQGGDVGMRQVSELQGELKALRDRLARREAKHDADLSEWSAENEALREQLKQAQKAKEVAESKLKETRRSLNERHEKDNRRLTELQHKNHELIDKLQQEQRKLRALQRPEAAPSVTTPRQPSADAPAPNANDAQVALCSSSAPDQESKLSDHQPRSSATTSRWPIEGVGRSVVAPSPSAIAVANQIGLASPDADEATASAKQASSARKRPFDDSVHEARPLVDEPSSSRRCEACALARKRCDKPQVDDGSLGAGCARCERLGLSCELAAPVSATREVADAIPPKKLPRGFKARTPRADKEEALAREPRHVDEGSKQEKTPAIENQGGKQVKTLAIEKQAATSKARPAVAAADEDSGKPMVGDQVQVEWLVGVARGVYCGEVIETKLEINSHTRTGAAFEYRYRVHYEDGDKRWETIGDITTKLVILSRAEKRHDVGVAPSGRRACKN